MKKLNMNFSDESRTTVYEDAYCPAVSKALFIIVGVYSVAVILMVISSLVGASDSSSITLTLNVMVWLTDVSKSIIKQFYELQEVEGYVRNPGGL